jgi:Cu(I)/Ag(I) efflux system membrane fusion protein
MSRFSKIAIAVVLPTAFWLGWLLGHRTDATSVDGASVSGQPARPATRKILYYRNPMGLPDTSPVPKKDSMGMDYLPVYEGQDAPQSAPAGTVVLDLDKIQRIGVRTETASLRELPIVVRASGTIRIDESSEYAIAPRFDGWVSTLHANQTGMRVKRGQPLMAVYSPQLSAVREEYRIADRAANKIEAQDPVAAASMRRLRDAALLRLRNWEIDVAQLNRSDRPAADSDFVLRSPADAIVLEKPITQGARFMAGETVLRLVDVSSVWVIAHVPSSSATDVAVGQSAIFRSVSLPGRSYEGVVEFIQPMIATDSRTVGVRIRLPNPDGDLRPGLFGDVNLTVSARQSVMAIPRSAVIDSGTRSLVFVEVSDGRFEPRAVSVGAQGGDRVEIIDGLSVGDKVVVSANFLIDAESNLKSALEGFGGHQGHGTNPAKLSEANGARPATGSIEESSAPHDHSGQSPPQDSRADRRR